MFNRFAPDPDVDDDLRQRGHLVRVRQRELLHQLRLDLLSVEDAHPRRRHRLAGARVRTARRRSFFRAPLPARAGRWCSALFLSFGCSLSLSFVAIALPYCCTRGIAPATFDTQPLFRAVLVDPHRDARRRTGVRIEQHHVLDTCTGAGISADATLVDPQPAGFGDAA